MQEWGAHPSYPPPPHPGPAPLPVMWILHVTAPTRIMWLISCAITQDTGFPCHICFIIQSALWEGEGTVLHTG